MLYGFKFDKKQEIFIETFISLYTGSECIQIYKNFVGIECDKTKNFNDESLKVLDNLKIFLKKNNVIIQNYEYNF